MEPVAVPFETLLEAYRKQRNAALDAAAMEHAADVARRDERIAELEAQLEEVQVAAAETADQLAMAIAAAEQADDIEEAPDAD